MSGSLIGALRVTLGIDTAAFEQGLGIAQKRLAAAGKNLQAVGDRMVGIGSTLSVAITAPLTAFAVSSVQAANESAAAMAQVNAALNSMGPVAGKTGEQLQKAAEDLQHLSTFDDDDILKSVTANMLTFGNISGDVFDRAQLAVVNLSARMGTDLQSATLMVGKALNDPVKGLAALGRAGIQFTADQRNMIKSMVASGDAAGAQAIMLGELERQFGGAAKAARDAKPGADTVDAWRNFQETVGAIVAQVLPPLTNILTSVLNGFNSLSPGTQSFIVGMAAVAAAVGPVLIGAGAVVSAIGTLTPIFAAMGPVMSIAAKAIGLVSKAMLGLLANPVILGAAVVIGGIYLAWKNWDKIKPIIDGVGAAISEWWTGNVQPIFDFVMEKVRAVGQFFGDYFGTQIGNVVRSISALLRGDFAGAWSAAKDFVFTAINAVLNVLNTLAPGAVAAVRALVVGVQEWIGNKLTAIWNAAKEKIQSLGDKFKWLWDVVVGHSYIPDLFDGIQKHAGRFEPEFVKPVTDGIDEVAASFAGLGDLGTAPIMTVFANDNAPDGGVQNAAEETGDAADELGDRVKKTTEQVVKDFGDMAAGVIRSLGNLKDTIKNGDFFDVVLSVLDVVSTVLDTIGQIKGIGGGGDASVNISGRASGGPVLANTPYIVGERRAELFVPSTSGRIEPNLNGSRQGGGNIINNYYGPGADEFWGKINDGHDNAARKGAAGGAQIAMQQLQRGRQRALA